MQITHFDCRSPFWPRVRACSILVAVVVFSALSFVSLETPKTASSDDLPEGGKDLDAYRHIVQRVHDGEDYYVAAGDVLRAGGYASSSVFNWRPPTYAWLLAAFPRPEGGQVLLCLLALAALAVAYGAECQEGGVGRAILLVLLMAGAFLWCIDGDAFFSQELWAGVLIALSVAAYMADRRFLAVAAGLAALFLRELAAPYVLVSLILSCQEKRWREVASWCGGLAVFTIFMAWHAWQVRQHLTGSELVEAEGWIQFGGPAFVIQTCRMNFWLFNLPASVSLLYLLAALMGLASWRGPAALRVGATAGVYLLAFLVVGKPFNGYWGLLFAALLPLGMVRFPSALKACAGEARTFGSRRNEASAV